MKVADDHLIMGISMGSVSPIHPKYFIVKNGGEK